MDLSANKLTGGLPLTFASCSSMQSLNLGSNLLSGNFLTTVVSNLQSLIYLNRLTGEIPAGIGNLVNLAVLQMGNNSLTGKVPPEIGNCRSLIWLDLNSNNLSGPLPPELCRPCWSSCSWNWDPARKVGKSSYGSLLSYNKNLFWHDGLYIRHKCSMIFLDLAYNSLSGTIPQNFGLMSYLQVLNLGHNKLTGNIPDSFGGLKAIGVLDLSHNDLQGFLPGSLGTLSFLSDLDVSNNNLTGPIPSGGQLTTFPQSRYENNSGLCGVPLPPCSSGGHPQVKRYQRKEEQREKYIDSLPTSGSSSWKLSATNGFSADSLIGSGGFGEVRGTESLWQKWKLLGRSSTATWFPLLVYCKIGEERLLVPFRRPTMIQVMAMFKELQVDSESDILDGFSLKDASIDEFREKESS
uniref:LRR receptor-like serine/threonine-protein kinase n=1 Tax=Populus alba TaxID=43335 RepID=A0A4U5NP63_POPAL|nr:hypothetical protein D5086_0000254590 [Populus alba]